MENVYNDYKMILRNIVKTYGTGIFCEVHRVNALLMDFAPSQSRERKLIVSALEEGIALSLQNARIQNEADQQICLNRCIQRLIDETWVTEAAAQFAVNSIAFAYGMGVISEIPRTQYEASSIQTLELLKGTYDSSKTLEEVLRQYQIIGYKALATEQGLTKLKIPSCIHEIKSKAFWGCNHLKHITLPSQVERIGAYAYSRCDSLEVIEIERNTNYIVIDGMLIDQKSKALMRATRSTNEKCIIPPDVTIIHKNAFERSDINEIVLPQNLEVLETGAFSFCYKLQHFSISSYNKFFVTIDGVLHAKNRKILIRFPSGYTGVNYIMEDTVSIIFDSSFSGTANLETLTFTNNLKVIGRKAFEYCPKLTSLVLPSNVEIIGERAFQYCSNLASVMLPRGIQEIGDFAFCGCSSIQTINVPRSVKKIGHAAFCNCDSLKKIIIQENVVFIGDGAFYGCSTELEVVSKDNDYVERYCNAHKINWSSL